VFSENGRSGFYEIHPLYDAPQYLHPGGLFRCDLCHWNTKGCDPPPTPQSQRTFNYRDTRAVGKRGMARSTRLSFDRRSPLSVTTNTPATSNRHEFCGQNLFFDSNRLQPESDCGTGTSCRFCDHPALSRDVRRLLTISASPDIYKRLAGSGGARQSWSLTRFATALRLKDSRRNSTAGMPPRERKSPW
jgi:hypothetical protein